jgi:hypothetical protein
MHHTHHTEDCLLIGVYTATNPRIELILRHSKNSGRKIMLYTVKDMLHHVRTRAKEIGTKAAIEELDRALWEVKKKTGFAGQAPNSHTNLTRDFMSMGKKT